MTVPSKNDNVEDECFSMKMTENLIRVAVVGNVDAGKSSLIGTMQTGLLDDGNGRARMTTTRLKHEIESGRTSTISSHLVGYDAELKPIPTYSSNGKHQLLNDADIARQATNFVSLMDLAGHEKYLKTTIQGISSGMIDYTLVLVNARHAPTLMTRQHINLAVACGIPIIIVLTKVDGCPKHALKATKDEISHILRSQENKKMAYQIKQLSDVDIVLNKMHAIVPVVSTSCVTGQGLDLLHTLCASLPKRRRHQQKLQRPFEFLVEDTFNVTGIGLVVSGFVNTGRSVVGNKVFVGPCTDGSFVETQIKSAHISRTDVSHIMAGNSACIGLSLNKDQKKLIRKGMVILEKRPEGLIPDEFQAEMTVLKSDGYDGTTIRKNYETFVHILHVKQCARVENIEIIGDKTIGDIMSNGSGIICAGSNVRITFRFMKQKEYIRKGMRILFRDGHLRACGQITRVGS
ncbi:hypothetical protein CTEN210_04948 [Chaetoceros tenuissimus]|uniref:Elongation factor Tu, chloroplastic n=1 Tax=Chaetoceros tenuissimus TaxID=426638 RepID=A0AAD3CLZ2_9STRA|nr:hypothetical protein CTEN210_04948 [Chaetoceros tenuissimus]